MLYTGCGKPDPATDEPEAKPEPAAAAVAASGSATGEGKTMEVGWGIAMWDEKEDSAELVLGFLGGEPTPEDLKKITSNKSLFMGVFLKDPLFQISIEFKNGEDGNPDISKPDFYSVLYSNFGDKGPMTLNRSAGDDGSITLTGELAPGGNVKGRLEGKDRFEMKDDVRNYDWDITVDLPVE